MKMRKSTWLLLVLALAAILLVAGCSPTTPPNGEEPGNGEPTPPPTDKECPKPVKTVVSKIYADDPATDANFQIKITFDEDFNSSCIENPAFWTITVANPGRVGTPVVDPIKPEDITVDGRVVTIKARVVETGQEEAIFEGLICNKADAERYAETFDLGEDDVPGFADEVSWKLTNCAVYDDLGNVCCDFSGKDCCVEPYCEECPPDGCDLTEPGACL